MRKVALILADVPKKSTGTQELGDCKAYTLAEAKT